MRSGDVWGHLYYTCIVPVLHSVCHYWLLCSWFGYETWDLVMFEDTCNVLHLHYTMCVITTNINCSLCSWPGDETWDLVMFEDTCNVLHLHYTMCVITTNINCSLCSWPGDETWDLVMFEDPAAVDPVSDGVECFLLSTKQAANSRTSTTTQSGQYASSPGQSLV